MSGGWTAVLVGVAGGLGATARMMLDGLITAHTRVPYPLGTTAINVTGSFLLGLLTGFATADLLTAPWVLFVGTGFLGGYTTFSTASLETVRLAQQGRWRTATMSFVGVLALAAAAAALGLWIGATV